MLQQGRAVADVLYLTPEGAPHIFRPPRSALSGNDTIPDRKGYNFDGCSPRMLLSHASVKEGKIVFPGGASYEILVLPSFETMTPELLEKIASLLRDGAIVVGHPPKRSPSLVGYPDCDSRVRELAGEIWGGSEIPARMTGRSYGEGRVYFGGELAETASGDLFPGYQATASLLKVLAVPEDFSAAGSLRYTHRDLGETQVYFVANRTGQSVREECTFRVDFGRPELWDPLTGERKPLPEYDRRDGMTTIPLSFAAYQSFFIVFTTGSTLEAAGDKSGMNFPDIQPLMALEGPWEVRFDPAWGGPERVEFEELVDWTARPEEGIRYYSGTASYHKTFELPPGMDPDEQAALYLDLGKVNVMARVLLNGKDLGVLWTAPWRVDVTQVIHPGENRLEVHVVNLWPNRLIGDEHLPDDGIRDGQWPSWLLEGKPRTSGRYTFTTHRFYQKDSPLLTSGLLGPVTLSSQRE
jgi:hypothetical protein